MQRRKNIREKEKQKNNESSSLYKYICKYMYLYHM